MITTVELPYGDGCKHLGGCGNVYAGRACALDPTKENGYTAAGVAVVRFVVDDLARGVAAGSELLALDPYTGALSGVRAVAS